MNTYTSSIKTSSIRDFSAKWTSCIEVIKLLQLQQSGKVIMSWFDAIKDNLVLIERISKRGLVKSGRQIAAHLKSQISQQSIYRSMPRRPQISHAIFRPLMQNSNRWAYEFIFLRQEIWPLAQFWHAAIQKADATRGVNSTESVNKSRPEDQYHATKAK